MSYDNHNDNSNTISNQSNINEQLASIRKFKHQHYLSFRSKNNNRDEVQTVISKTSSNDRQNKSRSNSIISVNLRTPNATPDNTGKWKPNTTLITGDSMILGIDESRISLKHRVKVRPFRGANIESMYDYIKPLLRKCPDNIILHIGTNNTIDRTSRDILNQILTLKNYIETNLPTCKVTLSNVIQRTDEPKASITINHLNEHLNELNLSLVDNSNINGSCLTRKGLHLNDKGYGKLAINFLKKINTFNKD